MMFWVFLVGVLIGTIIGVAISYRVAVSPLHNKVDLLTCETPLPSTTSSEMTEQDSSWMKEYPYDTKNFCFLGTPVNGIQFEKDKILFVEVTTKASHLNPRQQKIKNLVEKGQVEWFEFKMKERS